MHYNTYGTFQCNVNIFDIMRRDFTLFALINKGPSERFNIAYTMPSAVVLKLPWAMTPF